MKRAVAQAVFAVFLMTALTAAQGPMPAKHRLADRHWPAHWIAPPDAPLREYGVYIFRRTFELPEKPSEFVIHVSADNRYHLFVNGHPVGGGPARGDLAQWRYESLDVASSLQEGRNVLAAEVWNFGEYVPWAQMTSRTAFIVQGDGEREDLVNTDERWRVRQNPAYSPFLGTRLRSFFVVGPGDRVDGSRYPWGWMEPDYDDQDWAQARVLERGTPHGVGTGAFWLLVPRTIPLLEEKPERIPSIVRTEGVQADPGFLEATGDLVIPPHAEGAILLDQTYLTTAYPEITVSGGKGSRISLIYAEALYDEQGRKGNRNETAGRRIIGLEDRFLPDGGKRRSFRPLWLRTYRYLQLGVETEDEPLTIHELYGRFSAYPFEEKALFDASDPSLRDIWTVGWRTARLCAGETYFDCPYYEQLQYVGDTRIQALISLYVSGDDRLMRKAIRQFGDSRLPSGLTQSRYPSAVPQVIPPYSLFWVSMVYDYWMHRPDDRFVSDFLPAIRGVLAWYDRHISRGGVLGPMSWWNFVDWTEQWPWSAEKRRGGVPPGADDGHSSIISLHNVYTLQQAAELHEAFGQLNQASRYREQAASLRAATHRLCWDEGRGLLADTPEKRSFSQHANLLAVLVDAIPAGQQQEVMEKVVSDEDLTQCTFYFRFYLVEALRKVGLGDRYVEMLEPWHEMLRLGLTTFAERPEPTRSDCHAWSASPNYHLLSLVCGIRPDAPGFGSVRIEPHLGPLQWIEGSMPHPEGEIRVRIQREGELGLQANVTLPDGLKGRFLWKGKEVPLKGGTEEVSF